MSDPAHVLDDLERLARQALLVDEAWALPRLRAARERLTRGQAVDRTIGECRPRLEASIEQVRQRTATPLTIGYPEQLPVSARRDDILATLRDHRVFVLTGETGSGKTTQIPKLLLEAGYGRRGMIALTQPRRVAAVAMAARIREELQAPADAVVHSVRFDDNATPGTLVRVMTDGLLLAEASNDRDLARYDAIVIDEAHERGLNIDLLLGMLVLLRRRRPDLALVISSASIEAEKFAAYLSSLPRSGVWGPGSGVDDHALPRSGVRGPGSGVGGSEAESVPVVSVSGRMFPVDVRYAPPADDDIGYLSAAVNAIRGIHSGTIPGDDPTPGTAPRIPDRGNAPGDILCFLPTERDILDAARRLAELPGASILPLFSRLTPREQQKVFATARGRKVVLATNIAETSLTIPGIRYVVDAGMARVKRYQAASRTERLPVEAVSQASCVQRAGRAGRVEAGVCIRLFPAEDFAARDAYTTPEILRSNLAGVLLTCLHLGLGDPEDFPWLDAPAAGAWMQARGLLDELGALEIARSGVRGPGSGVASSASAQDRDQRPDSDRTSAATRPAQGPEQRSDQTSAAVRPQVVSRLSPLGRSLAAIPADPQIARILIAGLTEGVPHEACTIAAFLSVQDPRVRPVGQEAKADSAHRAIAHEAGDIATILRLWDRWHAAGSNAARNRLAESAYLGARRMREWADVRHQLWNALRERSARGPGGSASVLPAHGHDGERWPLDRVHRAVLAGMLGHVLMYDRDLRVYRGAGDRQLHVHPSSALRAGKADDGKRAPPAPPWLVACEVVETSRLFARLCAPIDPEWVIELAENRVRRRHRDAHFHAKRRQVVCVETVTWKGLPVRDGKLVPYERIDPAAATLVFIDQGLAGDEDLGVAVVERNQRLFARARRLRERLRDPSLHVEREHLVAFYRSRLGLGSGVRGLEPKDTRDIRPRIADLVSEPSRTGPRPHITHSRREVIGTPGSGSQPSDPASAPSSADSGPRTPDPRPGAIHVAIASTDALRRWIAAHGDQALEATLADFIDPALAERADRDYPEQVVMGGVGFVLDYRFAPGDDADGVTLTVGDERLALIDPVRLDWLVPGWLDEAVAAHLQQLPKDQRRQLIPLADTARALAAGLRTQAGRGPLDALLAGALRQRGVNPGPFAADALPPWLRPRFRVLDGDGKVAYEGRDPAFLAAQAMAASDRLRPVRAEWETPPTAAWPGDCPGQVTVAGISAHVALGRCRDASGRVAARRTVYVSAQAAAAWHDDGLDALLEAHHAADLERIATAAAPAASMARVEKHLGVRLGALRRHLALAAALAPERARIRELAAWDDLAMRSASSLSAAERIIDPLIERITARADALRARLRQGAKSLTAVTANRSVLACLDRLLGPGWAVRLPWPALARMDAYLDGLARRLDAAAARPAEVARTAQRIDALTGTWDEALTTIGHAPRLITALGLARTVRDLAGVLEECVLAFAGAPGGPASAGAGVGYGEGRLRAGLAEAIETLGAERDRIAETRQRLLERRPHLDRIAPGPRRDRLRGELERMLVDFPDLGVGADLPAQHQAAQALSARIVAALGSAA